MSSRISRRYFLKCSAAAAAAVAVAHQRMLAADAPAIVTTKSPNGKIGTACVAVGGRGAGHVGPAASERLVAICDVNRETLDKCEANLNKDGKIPAGVKKFSDYRKMFDQMGKDIDAVFVATPDHNHAAASMLAVTAGKHCYTEKPLTWCIQEARTLAETAAKMKVATQMGNQGHANNGNRKIVQWIRDGAIGEVKEVHTWTNRPIWPQGNLDKGKVAPVPAYLDWENWIGPAAMREYTEVAMKDKKGKETVKSPYVPFSWRGWFDFGCGAIGDMGCHTWDNVFWSMQPDYPESVELLEIENKGTECFPQQSKFKWTFPAKGNRPGFVAYWYSGGKKPDAPAELTADDKNRKMPGSGNLYIGTKGKLLVQGDYGDSPRLIPESFMKAYQEETSGKTSANVIEPAPIDPDKKIDSHHYEFLQAARGEKPWNYPKSNWAEYAGPLTEVMLVGSLAEKIGQIGFKIECDPVNRVVKTKEAAALVSRQYRSGWKLI